MHLVKSGNGGPSNNWRHLLDFVIFPYLSSPILFPLSPLSLSFSFSLSLSSSLPLFLSSSLPLLHCLILSKIRRITFCVSRCFFLHLSSAWILVPLSGFGRVIKVLKLNLLFEFSFCFFFFFFSLWFAIYSVGWMQNDTKNTNLHKKRHEHDQLKHCSNRARIKNRTSELGKKFFCVIRFFCLFHQAPPIPLASPPIHSIRLIMLAKRKKFNSMWTTCVFARRFLWCYAALQTEWECSVQAPYSVHSTQYMMWWLFSFRIDELSFDQASVCFEIICFL